MWEESRNGESHNTRTGNEMNWILEAEGNNMRKKEREMRENSRNGDVNERTGCDKMREREREKREKEGEKSEINCGSFHHYLIVRIVES